MKKRLALSCAAVLAILPLVAAETPVQAQAGGVNTSAAPERQVPELGLDAVATAPFRVFQDAIHPDNWGQVRIRQRVIIRVSPSPPDARERMLALAPRQSRAAIREVPHDDCVEVEDIIGVQPTQDNRLLLLMGNRQVLAATLDNRCTARAFYSGFYVEQSDDGRLCVSRDLLQSRAGETCSVSQLSRLVPAAD